MCWALINVFLVASYKFNIIECLEDFSSVILQITNLFFQKSKWVMWKRYDYFVSITIYLRGSQDFHACILVDVLLQKLIMSCLKRSAWKHCVHLDGSKNWFIKLIIINLVVRRSFIFSTARLNELNFHRRFNKWNRTFLKCWKTDQTEQRFLKT